MIENLKEELKDYINDFMEETHDNLQDFVNDITREIVVFLKSDKDFINEIINKNKDKINIYNGNEIGEEYQIIESNINNLNKIDIYIEKIK